MDVAVTTVFTDVIPLWSALRKVGHGIKRVLEARASGLIPEAIELPAGARHDWQAEAGSRCDAVRPASG